MDKIIVKSGKRLGGEVSVSGMKNAALPILFATILTGDKCVIDNIPPVSDIALALDILRTVGAEVTYRSRTRVVINTAGVRPCISSYEMDNQIRASAYLLGAELGRFARARVGWPGGCNFGTRPLDLHMKGFEAMGATMTTEGGYIVGNAENGLHSATVYLDVPSVGATVNLILAAATTPGETIIRNAAREPHIVDLASFLNLCGADIRGAGENDIHIHGVEKLHGTTYTICPDMIEAGTYMAAVAAVGGSVTLRNVIPAHLDSTTAKLREMGVEIATVEIDGEVAMTVSSDGKLRATHIKTFYYPGFPTDMQPQFAPLMCVAEGVSTISEGVWANRFRYVDELCKMGARISVDGSTATFVGGADLRGAPVVAFDLRAGAAMIIAGMIASGQTEITNVQVIDRGFYNIVGKLKKLGADIRRITD